MNIEYIGAGAGSGKTYTVIQRIGEALLGGDCEPAGLIATTYTKKAANELRQRIRATLYEQGRPDLAARMDEAMIGTVHSVCARILQRHAFAAGISPQLDVMDETDAVMVMQQMADLATSSETGMRLEELSEQLNQSDSQKKKNYWPSQLHAVLSQIRANDFSLADLENMAERTADEYLSLMGEVSERDLDAALLTTLDATLNDLPAEDDGTKKTQDAIEELENIRRQEDDGCLPWPAWIKMSRLAVGKKSEALIAELIEIGSSYPEHPRFRSDLREYITTVFGLAEGTLSRFQQHKQERGLVDYSDLEQLTYHLLCEEETVRIACAEQYQLLVVDEFQDTSPLQMALFLQLAACADKTLWVGDVKQSIYGFRGSDPQLVDGAVRRLREEDRLGPPLSQSWRSVPALVHLANELFAQPFGVSIGAQPGDVKLDPVRPHREQAEPPLEFLHVSTGKRNKPKRKNELGEPEKVSKKHIVPAIAERVAEILTASPAHQVCIKGTEGEAEEWRDIQPGDIAILCRKKDFAKEVAEALTKRGLAVSLSASGLMNTPEVSLSLACLRVIADRHDTLARAEVLALQSGQPLEQVLGDRINYVQSAAENQPDEWGLTGESANALLQALAAEADRTGIDAPSAILDKAMNVGRVWETVSQWGPDAVRSTQRRANLETLRGLARQYEEACHSSHSPATVGGFLSWCIRLGDDSEDNQAADPSPDAVQIATYHAAKGLEWPVVICAQLDSDTRDEWQNVKTIPTGDGTVNFDDPLADRTLHFWPSPFNPKSKDFGFLETIRNSGPAKRIQARAENEALRLLYVGITRARDRLILVTGDKLKNLWLDTLGAEWISTETDEVLLPNGMTVACKTHVIVPEENPESTSKDIELHWFPESTEHSQKPAATRVPSAEAPIPGAEVIETVEFGERLPFTGNVNDTALGNLIHGFLAYDLLSPGVKDRAEVARRLIGNHGLGDNLTAPSLTAFADRFSAEIKQRFNPKQTLVEVPFHYQTDTGQSITGFIDLLLKTDSGWFLIDHKSFPGKKKDWDEKALSYSGQLNCYRKALIPHGIQLRGTWIHFAVGGSLLLVATP